MQHILDVELPQQIDVDDQELAKVDRKLSGLTAQERETVQRLTKGIVAKLLHGPMSHLRTMDNVDNFESTVKSLEAMFKL